MDILLKALIKSLMYLNFQCPEAAMGGIFGVLNQRRGHVFDQQQIANTPQWCVRAYLPVMESFGKIFFFRPSGFCDKIRKVLGQNLPNSVAFKKILSQYFLKKFAQILI